MAKGKKKQQTNGVAVEDVVAEALTAPDTIASILAQSGCPPLLLKVEEEDLESYFLRTIGLKGGQRS